MPCQRKHVIVFFWELKDYLSSFLKYHGSFKNTKEDHLSTNFLCWKSSLFIPEIYNINFSFIQKNQNVNFSFLFNMNFSFVQVHCFVIIFIPFIEAHASFKHSFKHFLDILKYLLNLHYKGKCETELRNFFLWFVDGYNVIYGNDGGIRDLMKKNVALEFCRKK